MVADILYLTCYVIYLILLVVSLWFLLFYSGVPSWVWALFAVALFFAIIGVFIKEFFLIPFDVATEHYMYWAMFYFIFYFIVLTLIITGTTFAAIYSNIPQWIWVIIGVAIGLSILADITAGFSFTFTAMFMAIISFTLFIIGIIFLVIYLNAPWWIWIIVSLTVLFAILAAVFKGVSKRNVVVNTSAVDNATVTAIDVNPINATNPVIGINSSNPIIDVNSSNPAIMVQPADNYWLYR